MTTNRRQQSIADLADTCAVIAKARRTWLPLGPSGGVDPAEVRACRRQVIRPENVHVWLYGASHDDVFSGVSDEQFAALVAARRGDGEGEVRAMNIEEDQP